MITLKISLRPLSSATDTITTDIVSNEPQKPEPRNSKRARVQTPAQTLQHPAKTLRKVRLRHSRTIDGG